MSSIFQFYLPTTKPRLGIDVGEMKHVTVDYNIYIDSLGEASMMPCDTKLIGVYDECADRQVLCVEIVAMSQMSCTNNNH